MKKTNRLVTIFLMVCMVLASGGLLYATMYASGAGTQSTQTTLAFDAPSGIRYNELTGAFEVFSGVGVSWIGSNGWVSVLGEFSKDTSETPSDTQTSGLWYQATRTSTYNIMCDISYNSVFQSDAQNFVTAYNEAFNNGITLEEGGKIYGRGFFLSGFPVRNAAAASALIATNSGVIRNVNIIDVNFSNVATANTAAGILCGTNETAGLIDECAVYGSYSTARFTNLFGIAAVNNGTIMNSTNNANLTNTKSSSYTAGIADIRVNSNTVNNINNGIIEGTNATSYASGIAICTSDVEIIVSGNVNNGAIIASTVATGIVGGNTSLYTMRAVNNTNNGKLQATRMYMEYTNRITEQYIPGGNGPINGIRWNPDLYLFEVYNSAGFSRIAMMHWISPEGLVSTTARDGYEQASRTSTYRIMNDIEYDESEHGFFEGFKDVSKAYEGVGPSIDVGGIVDGGGHTLSNFPYRYVGIMLERDAGSCFFYFAIGVVENIIIKNSNVISVTSGGGAVFSPFLGGRVSNITCYVEINFLNVDTIAGVLCAASGGLMPPTETYFNIVSPLKATSVLAFGELTVSGSDGGVLGARHYPSTPVYVTASLNFMDIEASGSAAGVITADPDTVVDISNCINFGDITSQGGYGTGGISASIAGNRSGAIVDCVNYGNITGITSTGGIVGMPGNANVKQITGCVNHGDIIAPAGKGGVIVGCQDWFNDPSKTMITVCKNFGRVGISSDSDVEYISGEAVQFLGGSNVYMHGDTYGNYSPNILS